MINKILMLNLYNNIIQMATVKDWLKYILVGIVGALITISVTSFVGYPSSVTDRINKAEANANAYTDKSIETHEELQKAQQEVILEKINTIATSTKNTETIMGKLLDAKIKGL